MEQLIDNFLLNQVDWSQCLPEIRLDSGEYYTGNYPIICLVEDIFNERITVIKLMEIKNKYEKRK